MIIAKNFFISCSEILFECENTDLGVRRPSCFLFICRFLLHKLEHFRAEEYFKYSELSICHFSREWRKQTNVQKQKIRKTTIF
jgi:hypothetical protein